MCVKSAEDAKPPGSVCINGGECADDRACALLFDLTRSICQEACDTDDDCTEGRTCYEGFCLGGPGHEACPVPPEGCGCTTTSPAPLTGAAALGALGALLLRRRRR